MQVSAPQNKGDDTHIQLESRCVHIYLHTMWITINVRKAQSHLWREIQIDEPQFLLSWQH